MSTDPSAGWPRTTDFRSTGRSRFSPQPSLRMPRKIVRTKMAPFLNQNNFPCPTSVLPTLRPRFAQCAFFRLQKMHFVGKTGAELENRKSDIENYSGLKKVPFWYVRFSVACSGKAVEKNGYGLLTENRWYAAGWRRGRSTPKKFSHLFRKFRTTFPTIFPKIFRDR